MALAAACGELAAAPPSRENRVVRGWTAACRIRPACESGDADDRRHGAQDNGIADQLPIHGPPNSAGDDQAAEPFLFRCFTER